MIIDEAIRRLDCFFEEHRSHLPFDDREALALGIEALKRLRAYRRNEIGSGKARLPGETGEKVNRRCNDEVPTACYWRDV